VDLFGVCGRTTANTPTSGVYLKITVSGGARPSLGATQRTPANKLRVDGWMGLGTAARPGAATGASRPGGVTAADQRTAVGCLFKGSGRGKRKRELGVDESACSAVKFSGDE
jgi:hypothetical protein